jgi:hypothetical protein
MGRRSLARELGERPIGRLRLAQQPGAEPPCCAQRLLVFRREESSVGEPRWSPFRSPGWQCRAARSANFAERSVAVPQRRRRRRRRLGSKGRLIAAISAASESRPNPLLTPSLRREIDSALVPSPQQAGADPSPCRNPANGKVLGVVTMTNSSHSNPARGRRAGSSFD